MALFVRIFPFILVFVFLTGCSGESPQPVFTAQEIDTFIADNPAIMKAVRQALYDRADKDSDGLREMNDARVAKVAELGWDVDRYYYIFNRCQVVLSYENMRRNNVALGIKVSLYPSNTKADEIYEKTSVTLKRMGADIERNIPVSERVMILERWEELTTKFDGPSISYLDGTPREGN